VFSPAILIAAGIAAVIVVLDDLIVAFQGGNSVIRNFFLEFLGFDIRPVLQGIADVFGELVSGISGGAKIIFDLLEPFSGLIAGVAAAFTVAAAGPAIFAGALALITSPVTLIVAGIAGILFAVDDLSKALTGGQSVIADFFQEFFGFDIQPLLEEIVEGFKEVVETLKNFGVGIFESWMSIFSGIGDILSGNFREGFDKIGEGFSTMVDTLGELFRNVFGGIFDWAKNAALDILPDWAVNIIGGAGDAASGAASAVGDLASDAGGFISGLFNGGESDMPMAQPSQAMQPGGGRANNLAQSSTVEQNVTMEIRTSDPEKAGKAASDGLQRQLEDARNQTRGRGGS
jgi:phage-related protein